MSLTVSSPARGITTVTLDMPERRNALSAELVGALAEALGDLGADSATRAVLLTHTGPAFCSGADLKA
ncbi:enoyl-CoA hydratase/isomerase family protein, partial [Streptomyces sp. SID10116]|nr:enoyl-CoA hydratase/isomerase family protein [Streptomyces sp. SID10116]